MEFEADINFKVWCSDLEGYIFYLLLIALYKFFRTMKEMERYIVATYRNSCQPDIMTKTPKTFPNLEMPKIILDTGFDFPKNDTEMTYLKKKNIDKAICHKLRKKYVYGNNIHKIYNLIVSQTNEQLQEKAASGATF